MKNVVVEVRKGMVTEIYSDDKDIQFVVVDWDLLVDEEQYGSPGFVVDPSLLEVMPTKTREHYQKIVS